MAQILVDNKLMRLTQVVGAGQSNGGIKNQHCHLKRVGIGDNTDSMLGWIAELIANLQHQESGCHSPKTSREWIHQRSLHHRGSRFMTKSQI